MLLVNLILSEWFWKIINLYKHIYVDVMRQTAWLILNLRNKNKFAAIFNSTMVGRAADSITSLSWTFSGRFDLDIDITRL